MASAGSLTSIIFALICSSYAQEYYGKLMSSNWGANPQHSLSGTVYAVDERTFQVIGFTYDGTAPAGVFYLGTDKTYSQASPTGSDSTAQALANPEGTTEPLVAYDNEDVILRLPEGKTLADYTYISVWCSSANAFFGGFDIPGNFEAPKPRMIGQFTGRDHDVESGQVTIIDDKTIEIKMLKYDGAGPDAFFYVGVTDSVTKQDLPYGKIPDENGGSEKLPRYIGEDITLSLPDNLSFTSLKWLSIYCIRFSANFGEINIPTDLNVPPRLQAGSNENMNCEALSEDLQVSWKIEEKDIIFELAGRIDRNTEYMAFGLSEKNDVPWMVDADVVVTDFREGSAPRAIDYFINQRAQCADNGGACPDTHASNGGANNVLLPSGNVRNGITRVMYKRPLLAAEPKDKEYKTDGTEQQTVWAIGPINENDEVAKHAPVDRSSSPQPIDFSRPVLNNCPSFNQREEPEPKPDFTAHHLYGKPGTVFTAEIGLSAGEQGYKAITGRPSWGIAWYINGILIPELHLQRGVNYTFRVAGGTDETSGARYHPLYFTDSAKGGRQQNAESTETIYPGIENGATKDFSVGGYCGYDLNEFAKARQTTTTYQCFEEFQKDLVLECDAEPSYSEFTFTPTDSTPNLLYYQCYTHENLGWKVHVYDKLPTDEIATLPCGSGSIVAPKLGVITLLMLAVISRRMM